MSGPRARWSLAWLVTAGLACASPRTEILLVVGSDMDVPAEIDHVHVRAFGAESDGGFDRTYDLAAGPTALPLTIALVSAGGHAGPLHVDLTGSKGDAPVVSRSASTTFVEGQVLVLHMDLERDCALVTCPATGQTCVSGACATDAIPASSLPPYSTADAAVGGHDARAEATAPDDTKAGDAGAPDVATPDAPSGPDVPTTLADGASCAADVACGSGHCVDRVCCESACPGACRTCRATAGKCLMVSPGAVDPRGVCVDQGAASCGTTSTCDGAGACQRYPASACAPPTLVFGTAHDSALQGYDGPEATNFQDGCPAGSVVVGINAGSDAGTGATVVAQLQTKCGVPTASGDGKIVIAPSATLPLRGTIASALHALDCPANQAAIGFDGHALALLDQISLRCAPLAIAANQIVIGTATNIGPEGGTGGTPFPRTDCPDGAVAVGSNTAIRTWISGFGLVCAPISVK